MSYFPASTTPAARLAYTATGDKFTDLLSTASDKDVLLAFAEVSMAMPTAPHLTTRWNLLLVEAQCRMGGHPAATEVE